MSERAGSIDCFSQRADVVDVRHLIDLRIHAMTSVRNRLAMAAPLALQRGIEIEFHAGADCARPMHLESMAALLDNLISNAIKYAAAMSRIQVGLECMAPHTEGCRLTIADQGPGIAPALRQKVFERFYRIPGQEVTGSGLGLAIAERAALRNRAIISLAEGEGGTGLVATLDFLGEATT